MNFGRFQLSCEVMPLKFHQELLLKVICRLSTLSLSLVCHPKAACLIFADYVCTHTHMQTVPQA